MKVAIVRGAIATVIIAAVAIALFRRSSETALGGAADQANAAVEPTPLTTAGKGAALQAAGVGSASREALPLERPTGTGATGATGADESTAGGVATAPRDPKAVRNEFTAALAELEPAWQRCVEIATASAAAPLAGSVRLSFIVGPPATPEAGSSPGERLGVVELAEVDAEESTLEAPGLNECLAASVRSLELIGPPDGVDAVAYYFSVVVENGAVSGSDGREYALLRDTDDADKR